MTTEDLLHFGNIGAFFLPELTLSVWLCVYNVYVIWLAVHFFIAANNEFAQSNNPFPS